MGVLMWPPGEFWTACPSDFFAAFDGWLEAHGLKGTEPMDRERMNQLIEQQKKAKKARKAGKPSGKAPVSGGATPSKAGPAAGRATVSAK